MKQLVYLDLKEKPSPDTLEHTAYHLGKELKNHPFIEREIVPAEFQKELQEHLLELYERYERD